MPWRETSPMEQRLEFVREYETELFTMTELAAQYGISRKTGYKWVTEYEARGVVGLCDRSRRPHHSPQAMAPELVDALLALRRRHPRWGAKKLLAVAGRLDPGAGWPNNRDVPMLEADDIVIEALLDDVLDESMLLDAVDGTLRLVANDDPEVRIAPLERELQAIEQ